MSEPVTITATPYDSRHIEIKSANGEVEGDISWEWEIWIGGTMYLSADGAGYDTEEEALAYAKHLLYMLRESLAVGVRDALGNPLEVEP